MPIQLVYSRFNKYRSSGTQCVASLFRAKVIPRNIVERWNTYNNVLCKVENDNIVLNV